MEGRPAPGSIAIRRPFAVALRSDSEADEPGDGGGDVSIKSLWQVIVVIGRDDARVLWRTGALPELVQSDGKQDQACDCVDAPHVCVESGSLGPRRRSLLGAWLRD